MSMSMDKSASDMAKVVGGSYTPERNETEDLEADEDDHEYEVDDDEWQEGDVASEQLSQPQEPTVLQYTRFHGLTVDYSQELPRFSDVNAPSIQAVEADLEHDGLESLANRAQELTKEKLAIDKPAALLLKSVFDVSREEEELHAESGDLRNRMSSLRLELPILRTDPELDSLDFGNVKVPSFKDLRIPSEPVDVEKDEGFDWAAKYDTYLKKCLDQARAEKLNVSKEDLLFLSGALRDTYTPADSEDIKTESLEYKRKTIVAPLTPPLLPLSPPLTPYIPSSPGNRLELLSEDSNSTLAELKALDARILKGDVIAPPSGEVSSSSDIMLLDAEGRGSVSSPTHDAAKESPPAMKRKAQHLKIEGPLTPPTALDSPAKRTKSVSFPEMLQEYIPDLPSQFEDGNNVIDSQEDFMEFYKEVEPSVQVLTRKIENEKLSEVDTVMRFDVPDVDFTLPVAPWNEFARKKNGKHPAAQTELDAQSKFIIQIKRHYLSSMKSWHGLGKAEREMHWSPFPSHMATVSINEKLDGDDILSKLLEELCLADIVTSESAVWKREGLRILDDEGMSDEELELAESQLEEEVEDDMSALLRKRRLELDEDDVDDVVGLQASNPKASARQRGAKQPKASPQVHPGLDERHHGKKKKVTSNLTQLPARPASAQQPKAAKDKASKSKVSLDNSLMFGGSFSASSALHNFMAVHGKSIKEPEVKTLPGPPIGKSIPSGVEHSPMDTLDTAEGPVASSALKEVLPVTQQPKLKIKLPSIPKKLPPAWFIISSTLLQQRALLKDIERTYPDANFLERDFNHPYSAATEADILLSPSTGLIFTTLQQVKQRALPGQKDTSPLKERVSKLQMRYERLVVLVSEGLSREMEDQGSSRPVDASDTDALAQFEAFASKMEAEVLVQFVRGGQQALVIAIVTEMAKWGLAIGSRDIGDVKLLQEESFWELFLRRLGLNPFAAQAILSSLKGPYELQLESSSPSGSSGSSPVTVEMFGLAAFVLMDAEERIRRFQALLGGSRILTRVGKKMDRRWPSAVHGFVV